MTRTLRLIGGLSGIVAPAVYVATWAVLGATRAGYDPVSQAISELGEQGAATAPGMSAGFVAFGVLAVPFALALRRTLPGDALAPAAAAVICGVTTVGAAMFPCSPGCPGIGASATDTGHALTAVTGYLALMATPLLTGCVLWTAGGAWQIFARWSVAAGAVGAVLMLLWALEVFGTAGGAAQRIFNTLADVWWLSAGLVVLRPPRRTPLSPEHG